MEEKDLKKNTMVGMTTVQAWALNLLLQNGLTVNVFTCAQSMLVQLKLPK